LHKVVPEAGRTRAWAEVAVCGTLPEADRLRIFHAAGLSPSEAASLNEQILAGRTLVAETGVSQEVQALLADWHACNFFVVRGSPDHVHTFTAVRPGDALADLVFVVMFLAVQKELFRELESAGLAVYFPVRGESIFGGGGETSSEPFRPFAFMDDLPIALAAPSPEGCSRSSMPLFLPAGSSASLASNSI
jgi:hypothetical protein